MQQYILPLAPAAPELFLLGMACVILIADLFVSDDNFADDVFPGSTISADNNTESYWNDDSFWWHVFTGANYTGSHGCLPPDYRGNASATFKNTISSAYYSSSSC